MILVILTVGAIVFAIPFVNVVATSMKLDEEMAGDHFEILPRRPVARYVSPYAMEDTAYHLQRPVDLDRAQWERLRPPLEDMVRQRVAAWWDSQPQVQADFPSSDRAMAINSLTQVVAVGVLDRIGESSRRAGVDRMLKDVPSLIEDQKIIEAFNEYVPRFCVGDVRVRLADHTQQNVGNGQDWSAATDNAKLVPLLPPLVETGQISRMVKYDAGNSSPVSLTITLNVSADQARNINRVYVSFHGDQSWARIQLDITLDGRLYRLDEPVYTAERNWVELEVRIPGRETMPISGRTFFLLKDTGSAPADAPSFAVRLTLQPVSTAGAYWAKASRNYYTAFRQVPIARYIGTSISLAILSILLTVFGSSLSAYAFARLEFPGRNLLFGMLLATMMIPGQVTMVPGFLIYKSLGWYNSLLPLWAPALFGSAFFIFMMRQFFLSIPKELEDAARIDGCGFFGIYWNIMLPLIRPTLVTVAIFAFMGSWNNFMGPLIYVNDERLYNLAFGLFKFQLQSGSGSTLIMAGAFVMTLPIIAMFFIFQRHFVQGISLSGLGGR